MYNSIEYNTMPIIVKAEEASKYYGMSISNLRKLAREGKVEVIKTPGGHYRYSIPTEEDIENESQQLTSNTSVWSVNIIYTRVSSKKQFEELKRQTKHLQDLYPNYLLITDIGSGIDYNRNGFKTILERLLKGEVKHVIVSQTDRFTRFGFDFFQWLFEKHGAKLECVQSPNFARGNDDMMTDIMEVFSIFTDRFYNNTKSDMNNYNSNINNVQATTSIEDPE